jgi:hypothetical protein
MTEYGKHGKPRSRLSTVPTLRGHPFGITTFPRPRLLAYFKMQEHERPNPRPLDLKGVVMEVLGPKCNERSGTLRFEWRCCTPRLPAAAVAFHPPAPIGLFLASMPFRDLGYPAHESVMTSLSAVSEAPPAKSWELRRCVGALQIQRLEGSRPAGLWDLFLDEAVVVVCEVALAVGALPFQLLVAERIVVGRHVGESGAHHHTTF